MWRVVTVDRDSSQCIIMSPRDERWRRGGGGGGGGTVKIRTQNASGDEYVEKGLSISAVVLLGAEAVQELYDGLRVAARLVEAGDDEVAEPGGIIFFLFISFSGLDALTR